MQRALLHAEAAAVRGEVPVGAVLLDAAGAVIVAAGNEVEARQDPTAHAELIVMQDGARRRGRKFLHGSTLYVTLEPCPLCAAAISLFRIERVVFGAYDPKSGGIEHGPRIFDHGACHHRPQIVGGVEERAASDLLRNFFTGLRDSAKTAGR